MSFKVMNAQHGDFQREAKRGGDTCTDEQRASQSGSAGVGDGVEVLQFESGSRESLPDQRQQAPDVVSGSEFRHHAAIFPMHFRLRIKRVAQ